MARVCLLGDEDVPLRQTLLGHETAREALTTYELREPFHNAIEVETLSLGAAVSLLNDLNWYLVRYVEAALVQDPSVSETEWLSRDLATEIRDEAVAPEASGRYLMIYGVEHPPGPPTDGGEASEALTAEEPDVSPTGESEMELANESVATDQDGESGRGTERTTRPRLVEPMYVTRTGGSIPEYDLRDVEETVVVRVSEREFSR